MVQITVLVATKTPHHYIRTENTFDKNRKYFWNDDYLEFIVDKVWNISSPVDILEYACGDGYFGLQLLKYLPEGSTYTGVDNEFFISKCKDSFNESGFSGEFIVSDDGNLELDSTFHITICQCRMRHLNNPYKIIDAMKSHTKKKGIVACIDINRRLENAGLYIEGIDYNYLCNNFNHQKLWDKELREEGRNYSIGMKIPFYMEEMGLKNIDVRINDKVSYISPSSENYNEVIEDFISINGISSPISPSRKDEIIEYLMSRGYDRNESLHYIDTKSTYGPCN